MKFIETKQILKILIAVFIVAAVLRTFVIDTFIVKGDSMSPTILDGDFIFVNRLAYKFNEPSRKDVIVVKFRSLSSRVIKRVWGLPGERIEITENKIMIKDSREDEGVIVLESYLNLAATPVIGLTKIKLDPREYFILGDNRFVSIDSRELGPVDKWKIDGRVFFVISPRALTAKIFN